MNLDDPIDTLNLSVRGFNVLKREGVNTLGDLLEAEDRLPRMRNIGKALTEARDHIRRIRASMIDVSSRRCSLTADGGTVYLAGVTASLSPSDVDLGHVLVQIDTEKGTKLNVAINDGDVFRGDPEDPRNTFEVIRRAALAFLHSEDPESISLKDLADALGEKYEDVEAIVADEPRVVTTEDEELLDSEGHEHRASWLHDGDLFCEPGMDAHIVGRREDHGDTVLITDTEGIELSLDSDTVVTVVTGTRLRAWPPPGPRKSYMVIGDTSHHNLPVGAIVTPCDGPEWYQEEFSKGTSWYTQGGDGDEVAIDPRDLTPNPKEG